jgi:hypothetical protein
MLNDSSGSSWAPGSRASCAPNCGATADAAQRRVDYSSVTGLFDKFSFSKQVRAEAELRCTHATEGNLSTPKVEQFGQEENHLLLC